MGSPLAFVLEIGTAAAGWAVALAQRLNYSHARLGQALAAGEAGLFIEMHQDAPSDWPTIVPLVSSWR